MITKEKGQMVFVKHEFKPKPYWIVEWSLSSSIVSGLNKTQDTFWIIDANGNSKSVDESELTDKPPVAIFGELNERY